MSAASRSADDYTDRVYRRVLSLGYDAAGEHWSELEARELHELLLELLHPRDGSWPAVTYDRLEAALDRIERVRL